MTYCVVKGCHNTTDKQRNVSKLTFHEFPADQVVAAKWIKIIRKNRGEEFWKPKKSTKICSVHFNEKELYTTKMGYGRLKKGAVPTKKLPMCCRAHCQHDEDDIDNQSDSDKSQHQPQTQPEQLIFCIEEAQNGNDARDPIKLENQPQPKSEPVSDDDDMLSIFDSPQEYALRKQLARKIALERKHKNTIKALQQKVRRLQVKNASLQISLKKLRKKRLID